MSNAELKIDIINKITNLNDSRIINEIQKLLEFEMDEREYILTEAQVQRINEAKLDEVISESDANKAIEEWLQKK